VIAGISTTAKAELMRNDGADEIVDLSMQDMRDTLPELRSNEQQRCRHYSVSTTSVCDSLTSGACRSPSLNLRWRPGGQGQLLVAQEYRVVREVFDFQTH
jgi:hypothetical protein